MSVSKSLKDFSIGMANGTITDEKSMKRSLGNFNPGPSGEGESTGTNTFNIDSNINGKVNSLLGEAETGVQTILGTYNERRKLAEDQGNIQQEQIKRSFQQQMEDSNQGAWRDMEGKVEQESGFARHALVFRNLAKDAREAIRDLTSKREEALLLGQSETASRLDKLILDQETAVSAARTRYTDLLFKSSDEIRSQAQEERNRKSFETPEEKRARDFEMKKKESTTNLMTVAPDAGILDTDDFNTAIQKYRQSATYKRDVTRGEQEIELMRANIAKAWAEKALTDAQKGKIDVEAATAKGADKQTSYQLERANRITDAVDEAIAQLDAMGEGVGTSGLTRFVTSEVPGSEAYNLEATVNKIISNIGFNELQAMRAASPTGGALGQVAVQELEMLQSVLGSIDLNQGTEELRKNLNDVRLHYTNWANAVNEANGVKVEKELTAPKGLDELGKQFLQVSSYQQ